MEPPTSSKKRRKGGIHQRQHKAEEEMQCESALYALLMIYFAKGLMSGALVHKISQAAQEDIDKAAKGWNVQGLNKVASLKHARNLGASLARMMAKESDLPEPFHVHIPLKKVPSKKQHRLHSCYPTSYLHPFMTKDQPGPNVSCQINPCSGNFGIVSRDILAWKTILAKPAPTGRTPASLWGCMGTRSLVWELGRFGPRQY